MVGHAVNLCQLLQTYPKSHLCVKCTMGPDGDIDREKERLARHFRGLKLGSLPFCGFTYKELSVQVEMCSAALLSKATTSVVLLSGILSFFHPTL